MKKLLIALAMTAAGLFAFGDGATSTPVSWAAKPLTADPSSIVSDGTLVYAYARSGQTVNGVQFEGVTLADDEMTVENDDISWTLANALRFTKDSTIDGVEDSAYNGLLSHSWDAHDDPAAAHPVVLKNLKPGATYIVQIVASQLVGDNDAKIWPMATPEDTFVDGTTPYIMSYAETDWPYGGTLIGKFTATADTATVYYGIKGSWCGVNAIQVREAGVKVSPAYAEFYPTQEVTLSCPIEDAEIRYTTDGSDPTASSLLYESPIAITASTVVKAAAFKSGVIVSAIASGKYVYVEPGTAPQPNFGIYEKAIKFTTAGYTGSETLTDFPVLVRLAEDSLTGFSYADVDSLDDLRFADEQGNEIPCEVENWNPDGESQIWVKLPSMTATTTFTMYYNGQADTEADPTAVWTDYVGVWHMSEASGTVRDSTGHGLDAVPGGGQVSDSVAFAGGPAGVARQFATAKGNKTYLVVPSYDSFALGNNFTIQGWFKATECFTSYSARYLSRKNAYTDGNGWEFEQRYDAGDVNKTKTTVSARGATKGDAVQTVPDITTAWLDLALNYNGKNAQYYVNGAVGDKAGLEAAASDNGKPLVIGNCPTGEESNWVGQMDEIRLRKGDVTADRMLGEHETVADVAFLSASAVLQVSESTVVATPKFNPQAGTVYEATEVAISCLTEGATIRYTLDGTDPDETSAVYEGPITVAETTTIKAVAFKDDLDASKIVTAVYTYEAPVGPELGEVTVTPQSKTAAISGEIVSVGNNGATACDVYLSLNGGAAKKVVTGATDSFTYAVQNLEPETEYAYVLSISNNAATVMGAETSGSFTTTGAPAGLEPVAGDADATRALIQDAIDAAAAESPVGTVVLAAGTFEINHELKLKGGVTLEGQGWDQTIIRQTTVANKDKTYAYRCVTIEGGSKLFGVTLTGGDAYQIAGGGALVKDGTISWCCISNNITSSSTTYAGAGVSFSSGKGSIDHSIIVGNKLQSGWGAGIGAETPSGDILIDTCLICGNVNNSGSAGGVAIDKANTTETTTIRNCTIVGNTATGNVGGVYSNNGDNGKLVLVNNIITGNKQGSNEINLFIQNSHLDQEASSNCLVTGSYTGTGPWKDASVVSTLADKGFTNVAPTFVGAGNYRLAEESAGIAAGVSYDGIGVDLDKIAFAAETPSIGCYESGIMAAKPTFDPAAGTEFYPTMSVTISCETEGAVIRYTLDGTKPTETSAEYTEPIVLSATTTIKARAFAAEVGPSPVVTGKFILVRPTPPPEAFSKCVEITLNTALADTEIKTGLPALVKLDPEVITGFDYADFTLENGGDMMFTDADGKAIPHEVDTWNPEGVSLVWVKIPSTAADTVIKLYYGNGTVSSAEKTDVWSDYVGVWHLNEAGGANTDVNVYDSTANGYTGVAKGHASSGSTDGKIGSAWTISDSTNTGDKLGGILVNSMKDVELGTSFTVSAWLWHRNQGYNYDHVFYRKNASADGNGFASEINSSTYGALNVYGASNSGIACPFPDTREKWAHYSVSFGAKVNNDYVIYTIANGGTSDWKVNNTLPTDNGLPLAFGTDCDNNDISWKGAFDEIRIRKGAFDENYLRAEYKAMNTAAADIFTFGEVEDLDTSVADVNGTGYDTVEEALAAVQALEAAEDYPITVTALAEDGVTIEVGEQSVALAKDETITITADDWTFSGAFAGHVTLLPGKAIIAKGLADGAEILVPDGMTLLASDPDADGFITYVVFEGIPVAKVGDNAFTTLADAIAAAEAGDTVTLLKDVSEKITIAAGKQLTLDLNAKTLTGTDANYVINNLGTLVITGNGVVDSTAVSHNTLVRNGETGVMTIENGTFKSARITVKNDENGKGVCGQLTINGGTFLASSEQGTEVWDSVQNWGVATINGGEFDGYIECRAESNWNAGVMTITGGTFQKPVQTVVVFDSTHNAADNAADVALTIEGGTFNDMVMRVADVKAKAGEAANVRVDFDESMPEYVASCETLGTVTIPGKVEEELNAATFANDESVYCEEGFRTTLNGDVYTIDEIVYVAQVGEQKFETAEAALAAVQALELSGTYPITVTCLAEELTVEFAEQSVTLKEGDTVTVAADGWTFSGEFAGHVTLVPGKSIVAKGMLLGAVIDVPADYKLEVTDNGDGTYTYTAVAKVYVAQVADAKFETLDEAFEAVEENGTVVILQDLTVESLDAITKNLTIDANGNVITLADAAMTLTNDITVVCSGDTLEKGVKNEAQITIAAGKTLDLSALSWGAGVVGSDSGTASFTLEEGAVYKQGIGDVWDDQITNIFTAAEHCVIKLEKSDDVATITAEAIPPMFMIGETGYDSWAEAAAAAKEGDTIKVGVDAVIPNPGSVLKGSVPVDLCGQSLTFQGGWLTSGSFTFVDSVGGGVLSMPNGLNCSTTLDLSGLQGDQVVGINGNIKVGDSKSLVKFPEDWDLDTCKKLLTSPADGASIVVQGVTYVYDSAKGWVPEGCYDIIITAPENGSLETSVTNAVPAGTTVTVTATPAEGYQLVSITTNGEAIAGAEFVMPEEDVTVAATFESAAVTIDFANAAVEGLGATFEPAVTSALPGTEITATYTNETKIATGATTTVYVVQPDGTLAVKEGSEKPEAKDPAAKIGTVLYLTLQDAVNEGGEVVMLADCTEMVVVPAGVEVTLDFNGYKIDVNGWAIKNRGTLTIDDGVVNASEAAITMYGDSVTTINGGTFTSADNAVIMGQGSEVNGNVKLTINGGEFNGGIVTSGYVACGVYAANSGVYAINGGTFNIVNGCGICARAGQITVGDEAVINVSGEIEGKVGDKATPIPCVALYVDRTEPPYPGYVAETDYLKATSNTLKIDDFQFWVAEDDDTYSLHDVSEAVATVNDDYFLTVEGAFAALQAAEAAGVEIIESLCLAEDGIEFQFEGQSVSLAYMELLTVRKDMWLFKHFPFAGHVTLLPGKTIVAKGLADGATIDVPAGYVLNAADPDPMGYIAYTAVPDVPAWDIVGGEGGINALVKEDGVTKYVEFTSITLTETGATVGLKAAKIDANGAEFALICKTALTDTETFTLPATLNYEKGELGDATEGLFTVTADLSGYKQLFVVGVGPKVPANE